MSEGLWTCGWDLGPVLDSNGPLSTLVETRDGQQDQILGMGKQGMTFRVSGRHVSLCSTLTTRTGVRGPLALQVWLPSRPFSSSLPIISSLQPSCAPTPEVLDLLG